MSEISYQELISGIDFKEKKTREAKERWELYCNEARKVAPNNSCYRMVIAELAIRAVAIVKKGKRKVDSHSETLSSFSMNVQIDRRTLGDWVKAKVYVFDQLSESERAIFKLSAAIAAVEKDKEKAVQGYLKLKTKKYSGRKRQFIHEYLRAAASNLRAIEYSIGELELFRNDANLLIGIIRNKVKALEEK